MKTRATGLRSVPSIEQVLSRRRIVQAIDGWGRALVVRACRTATSALRARVLKGDALDRPPIDWIEAEALRVADETTRGSIRRVINATGVLLHTNLGRAPLSPEIIERAAQRAAGYSNLELDLETGRRGSRVAHMQKHVGSLIPGAAVLVVNNNASAVLLILNTLAAGREVVVSRGELVEIGGSFRIPDICERSGARLREVGTTNRTRLSDYERAIRADTSMLMRVHPSNFRVVGFTEEVDPADLAKLARSKKKSAVADLGSGTFFDLPAPLGAEPSPIAYLRLGYDLVCFSGDKLLGACQAGLILGKPRLIERLRKNALYRALRPDKLTLALLEEVLLLALSGRHGEIPLLRMALAPIEAICARAEALALRISAVADAQVEAGDSLMGGGSSTDLRLPTALLHIAPRLHSEGQVLRSLRSADPPVIARLEGKRVVVDLRSVDPEDDELVAQALEQALR